MFLFVLEKAVELLDNEGILPDGYPTFRLLLIVLRRIVNFLDMMVGFLPMLGIVAEVIG
jgi:hypothetical protein